MGLPRDRRITKRREITALLKSSRVGTPALEVYWRPATGVRARATCVVPKYGHDAVSRNLLRRRLQALTREHLLSGEEGRDWLIRARPPAYRRSYVELEKTLRELLARIGAPRAPEPGC